MATGFLAAVFLDVFGPGAFAAGFLVTGLFASVLAVFLATCLAGVRPAAFVGDLVAVLRVVAIFKLLRKRPDPAISAGFEREKPPNTSGFTVMFRGFVKFKLL